MPQETDPIQEEFQKFLANQEIINEKTKSTIQSTEHQKVLDSIKSEVAAFVKEAHSNYWAFNRKSYQKKIMNYYKSLSKPPFDAQQVRKKFNAFLDQLKSDFDKQVKSNQNQRTAHLTGHDKEKEEIKILEEEEIHELDFKRALEEISLAEYERKKFEIKQETKKRLRELKSLSGTRKKLKSMVPKIGWKGEHHELVGLLTALGEKGLIDSKSIQNMTRHIKAHFEDPRGNDWESLTTIKSRDQHKINLAANKLKKMLGDKNSG